MKHHRILALCAGVITAGAACVHAQTTATPSTTPASAPTPAPTAPAPATPAAPTPPSLSSTLQLTWVNQYMFRGVRLGGSSFEPELLMSYGNWSWDVWTNFPLADRVPGQSDPEIDPQASYTFAITDSLSVIPGFTWYNYPSAPTDQGFFKYTFEPNLSVHYTVAGITIAPEVYYDVILKGPTYELDAFYTIPLKEISSEIDLNATVGTYEQKDVINGPSPKTKTWGNYFLVGVAMPFPLTKELKLVPGFAWTKGTDAYFKTAGSGKVVNTAALSRGVVTVTLAYSF